MKQTKREQLRLQRQQETKWIALIVMAIVIVVGVVITLIALDSNDIDLHTTQTKQVTVIYPKTTEYVTNNITNTEVIEKSTFVDPEYTTNCIVTKNDDVIHMYCPAR